MDQQLEVVVITGMSGAGKTVAVQSFEDSGYFVIDNMVPSLAPRFIDVIEESHQFSKIAMVMDARSQSFYDSVLPLIHQLRAREDITMRLLFLDADDVKLVARYKETRREHPLSENDGVMSGIQRERQLLATMKSEADLVVDTTTLTPRQLRLRLQDYFGDGEADQFYINVMSFGFKYGLPLDADIVMDVRFLPNPFYLPELKHLTGNDQAVQDYVMQTSEAQAFYRHFLALLMTTLPGYIKEGKSSLTIAIGCTGGQHRSVIMANRLSTALSEAGYQASVHHRDVEKAQ